jgi:uncharacterized membrane protein YkoI
MNGSEIKSLMLAVAFSVVIGGVCYAAESRDVMSWDNVPAAVQNTVADDAVGLKSATVENEAESSVAFYQAKVTDAEGSRPFIKATEDGSPITTKTGKVYPGQNMDKDAKISISQARAIALKAQPGQITDEELEKEKGGSGLRYSFDIRTDSGVHEVGVDAVSGAVLENSVENENHD